MFGVKQFHLHIYGRQVEIHTDHKPKLSLQDETKAIQHMSSSRLQRWALTPTAYFYTLKSTPGRDNAVADAQSRLTCTDTPSASKRACQAFPRTRPLLYVRPASEQLCGTSLVTRKPIGFPPRRLLGECLFYAL